MANISRYFDYAAATPVDPSVVSAMLPYLSDRFYNPSATYLAAQSTAMELTAARAQVAHWLGARPSEIIFTAGGTEANNLAIHGVMKRYPKANLIVSAIEHESVLEPAVLYSHKIAAVTPDGLVDISALSQQIDDHTVLISVMYANNEVGTIQPIKKLTEVVTHVRRERRARGVDLPLLLHTDACQAAAYLDLHTARLGVDLMTINGGKIYGPKQSGALFIKAGIVLTPQILGGGQERGVRSGTENVAQAVGLAAALDSVQTRRHDASAKLQRLQQLFMSQIEALLPSAVINGSRKHRLPNNVHVTLPGTDNERLIMELDEQGFQCAAGSACTADSGEPSHVLTAMGLSDAAAQSSLRFTMGQFSTEGAVKAVIATLVTLLRP